MVKYFKQEGIEGPAFRCDRYMATLQVSTCAKMWREGNQKNVERLFRCRACLVGAVHAGETAANLSPLMGRLICARCHEPSSRLIGKQICVSCYNRQREWLLGKNSKGTIPRKQKTLEYRRIWFAAGGELKSTELPLSIDTDELIVATLRDSKKNVQFLFRSGLRGAPAQMRLW